MNLNINVEGSPFLSLGQPKHFLIYAQALDHRVKQAYSYNFLLTVLFLFR